MHIHHVNEKLNDNHLQWHHIAFNYHSEHIRWVFNNLPLDQQVVNFHDNGVTCSSTSPYFLNIDPLHNWGTYKLCDCKLGPLIGKILSIDMHTTVLPFYSHWMLTSSVVVPGVLQDTWVTSSVVVPGVMDTWVMPLWNEYWKTCKSGWTGERIT